KAKILAEGLAGPAQEIRRKVEVIGYGLGDDASVGNGNSRGPGEADGAGLAPVHDARRIIEGLHGTATREGEVASPRRSHAAKARPQQLEVSRQRLAREGPRERVVEAVSIRGRSGDLGGIGFRPAGQVAREHQIGRALGRYFMQGAGGVSDHGEGGYRL